MFTYIGVPSCSTGCITYGTFEFARLWPLSVILVPFVFDRSCATVRNCFALRCCCMPTIVSSSSSYSPSTSDIFVTAVCFPSSSPSVWYSWGLLRDRSFARILTCLGMWMRTSSSRLKGIGLKILKNISQYGDHLDLAIT